MDTKRLIRRVAAMLTMGLGSPKPNGSFLRFQSPLPVSSNDNNGSGTAIGTDAPAGGFAFHNGPSRFGRHL